MFSLGVKLGRSLGILLGVLTAVAAQAQQTTSNYARVPVPPAKKAVSQSDRQGAIHRIELYSGTRRSVLYMPSGDVSISDRATARELQHAENEESYLYDLEQVKQQYVSDERLAEQQRHAVQQELYGKSITTEGDSTRTGTQNYNNGYGGYGMYGGYGLNGGFGMYGGGYGLYGGGYGGYGYGGRMGGRSSAMGHSETSVTRSLKDGVGDEGRMKAALAPVLASQASPEYAEHVLRTYEKTAARAAASPVLAKTLSLRKAPAVAANYEPSFTKDSKVAVWVGNDKYDGVVKSDRSGWVVLETDDGEVSLRKSTIERSLVHNKPKGTPTRTAVAK